MQIKHHSDPKYFIVTEPTDEAVALAESITGGNWAKRFPSGNIVVHSNFRRDFERIMDIETRRTTICPEFAKGEWEAMQLWAHEHFNDMRVAKYASSERVLWWNQFIAGHTISEIEKRFHDTARA